MSNLKVWTEQNRLGNLTRLEVNVLLGEDDLSPTGRAAALKRARAKLRTAEMIILVRSDEDMVTAAE